MWHEAFPGSSGISINLYNTKYNGAQGTTDKSARTCTQTHTQTCKTIRLKSTGPAHETSGVNEAAPDPSCDTVSNPVLIFQALNPICFFYLVMATAYPTSCITSQSSCQERKKQNKPSKQPKHSTRHPANASSLLEKRGVASIWSLVYTYNISSKN